MLVTGVCMVLLCAASCGGWVIQRDIPRDIQNGTRRNAEMLDFYEKYGNFSSRYNRQNLLVRKKRALGKYKQVSAPCVQDLKATIISEFYKLLICP